MVQTEKLNTPDDISSCIYYNRHLPRGVAPVVLMDDCIIAFNTSIVKSYCQARLAFYYNSLDIKNGIYLIRSVFAK